ncbi:MAG: ABC transporter permease [Spirochaetaceae bacterium]|nr:ABC transporter permease [Spirochaetaceae bacterium]
MPNPYEVWGGTMHNTDRNTLLSLGNKYRIYILFVAVFAFMSLFAPKFFNPFNLTTIMRSFCMNACVAIGFTIVLICGQLDLSIGTIITFAGVVGLGLKEQFGYWGSVPVAVVCGALIGLINGLLVAKGKISSFIVTLGTMTILQGAIYQFTGGNSVSLSSEDAFAVSDFLSKQLFPLITPRVLITLFLAVMGEIFLKKTRVGRNFYLVGGNKNSAWLAGINTDNYTIFAFVLSGTMAALGGVLFAMESSAATLKLGEQSLMYVLSATIIGGTSTAGGKGGIMKSVIAILTLEMLYTGIILFGLGNEVKIFIAGLILALVVLYEAFAQYRHEKTIGRKPSLMKGAGTKA